MYDKYKWSFEGMEANFDEHVTKSVPLYNMFHNTIVDIAPYFINENTKIVDIGTSTGTLIKKIYDHIGDSRNNKYIGLDVEEGMIELCREKYSQEDIEFIICDALTFDFSNTSVITIMLVLQFLEKKNRIKLLKKIYDECEEGSAVFIVEKIKTQQHDIHDLYNDLYYDFKRETLTDKEILDKNSSLRGIMKPLLIDESIKILEDIGFKVEVSMKYMNFVELIAIK